MESQIGENVHCLMCFSAWIVLKMCLYSQWVQRSETTSEDSYSLQLF